MGSATSNILGTHSYFEGDIDPDLPTEFPSIIKATPEKDVVIDEAKTVADEGNSEKILLVQTEKSSMESAEASKPAATPEILI